MDDDEYSAKIARLSQLLAEALKLGDELRAADARRRHRDATVTPIRRNDDDA